MSYEPTFVASLIGKVNPSDEIISDSVFPAFEDSLPQTLKPQSVYSMVCYFRKYVAPFFSGMALSEIDRAVLGRLNVRLNKAPSGSLMGVLACARHWINFLAAYGFQIPCDPIFRFRSFSPEAHVYHVWKSEQEQSFLSVIDDPQAKLLFSLFVYYGLRISECLALKWSDFSDDSFKVSRIVCVKTLSKKQIFTSPKSVNSVRTLPIVAAIKPLLKERETGWLFPGQFGATVMGATSVYRLNRRFAKKAGFEPIKIHEFRDSCASNLIRSGISSRLVAKWLGDKEATILNYYSHEFPDEKNVISDWINTKGNIKEKN
jgi:Site-specific recombinase XerD